MGLLAKAVLLRDPRALPLRIDRGDSTADELPEPEPAPASAAPAEPIALPNDSRPADGLLRRSELALEQTDAPAAEPEGPVAAAAELDPDLQKRLVGLAAEIMDAKAGIEAPGRLFELLGRSLGLSRAAILVPDSQGSLSPWAASGLDRTTLRRMRFGAGEAAALVASTVKGAALAPYLHLFSSRDSAALERLALWPCPGAKEPVGLVVVADVDSALSGSDMLQGFLPGILQSLGQVLQERREDRLVPIRSLLARPAAVSPVHFIDEAIGRLEESPRAPISSP